MSKFAFLDFFFTLENCSGISKTRNNIPYDLELIHRTT